MTEFLLKFAGVIFAILTFGIICAYVYGKNQARKMGYNAYPETLPKRTVNSFEKQTIFRLLGTTEKSSLYVIEKFSLFDEEIERFILMDLVNFIPKLQLETEMGATYKIVVSEKPDGKIIRHIERFNVELFPDDEIILE